MYSQASQPNGSVRVRAVFGANFVPGHVKRLNKAMITETTGPTRLVVLDIRKVTISRKIDGSPALSGYHDESPGDYRLQILLRKVSSKDCVPIKP